MSKLRFELYTAFSALSAAGFVIAYGNNHVGLAATQAAVTVTTGLLAFREALHEVVGVLNSSIGTATSQLREKIEEEFDRAGVVRMVDSKVTDFAPPSPR